MTEPLVRIKKLAEYLRTHHASIDDLMQFVALNTLDSFGVITIFLATVKHDGLVSIVSKFGCSEEGFASIPDRRISVDVPVNRALRTATIVECGSSEEYLFAGPGYHKLLFPNGFGSSIAFPVPDVGSMVIYCRDRIELSIEKEEFLLVVGLIISMDLVRVRHFDISRVTSKRESPVSYALTARQWKVLEGILIGLSNEQIAVRLGLSETLVRSDVTTVMSKLGAADRSAIRNLGDPASRID
jgi:DNA-binding CsgD family transcriptional regulator